MPILTVGLLIVCGMISRGDEPGRAGHVGPGNCATYGCHGNTTRHDSDPWKSSFVLWAQNDPHAGAFHVLFSSRSAKIVELLIPTVPADPTNRLVERTTLPHDPYSTDYWNLLEKRCLGCHATPAATISPDTLRHGVSCESCHGAASKWLNEHATSRWTNYSPAEKAARWGLTETKSLGGRAAVCVECHVGPSSLAGKAMDVDHDLIAAGHPRLSFEFSAYLANLPPHWDERADKSRSGAVTFQFDAWRSGQFQVAKKLADQLERRSSPASGSHDQPVWPEFSNFDCFACHHRLRAERYSIAEGATFVKNPKGEPEPADWPFAQLQSIVRFSDQQPIRALERPITAARERLASGWRDSAASQHQVFAELHRQLDKSAPYVLSDQLSRDARVAILCALLDQLLTERAVRWDRVVQANLALTAFVEDTDPGETKRSAIGIRTVQLADYLDRQFDQSPSASIYDSPARFDPDDKKLRKALEGIKIELQRR